MPEPIYFATPNELRAWFEKHHETVKELSLGFHKVGSGPPSVTWPQAVDEALCFGWIDGVRKRIDDENYFIRFTPRKTRSKWSKVNMGRIAELQAQGRVTPAGLKAYEARAGIANASYEQEGELTLSEEFEHRFRANEPAWAWFRKSAPSYQKACIWWIISAKQEATKERRLQQLISDSAAARQVPPFIPRTGK